MIALLGELLVATGAVLLAIAAYGLFALDDALGRQHAATKAGTLALTSVCVGTMLASGEAAWILRLGAIIVFLLLTLPLASHMLARAAVQESGEADALSDVPRIGDEVDGASTPAVRR
jgi:multicomponent Na+:H+ antiporter subunit G